MGNLFGIGLSGLGAAQAGLRATSNNISNVNTPGYTRRSAILAQAPVSQGRGAGVSVTAIQRHYQRFLSVQLSNAESRASALNSHLTQMSHINNLLGDSGAGLAPLMQDFFASVQTVAANPADPAAREALLGDAHNMATQFRTFSSYLSDMDTGAEEQLGSALTQINNYGKQIAKLNDQISLTRARTGHPPNKLLDERNQLVAELGKLVDPEITIQDGDKYMVMVAGRPLVDANGAHSFVMTVSDADTSKRVIAYSTVGGSLREIDPEAFNGGTVGGLIEFRHQSLQSTQLRLNQLAHAMAASVNRVHASGYDLDGETGKVFFSVANGGTAPPVSYTDSDNTGGAALGINSVTSGENFRIKYVGNSSGTDTYEILRVSDGTTYTAADTNGDKQIAWAGNVDVTFNQTPADGDSFLVRSSGSFSPTEPVTYTHADNLGNAELDVHFNGNLSKVVPSNYRIEYTGTGTDYTVTRLSDGTTSTHTGPAFSVGGFSVTVNNAATAQQGDSFLVKPLAGSAAGLNVAISDSADIAAANPDPNDPGTSGAGGNGNALELAKLQSKQVVGGQASVNDAYAQLVSDVGNKTSALQVNSAAQASLTSELQSAEQSVSGVNLAEERVNLMFYSKLYRANASVIQTATTIFDTILRIA